MVVVAQRQMGLFCYFLRFRVPLFFEIIRIQDEIALVRCGHEYTFSIYGDGLAL